MQHVIQYIQNRLRGKHLNSNTYYYKVDWVFSSFPAEVLVRKATFNLVCLNSLVMNSVSLPV